MTPPKHSEEASPVESSDEPSVPEYISTLVEGTHVCGDSYAPLTEPAWLDKEKYRRGQKFATAHLWGVMFAELQSLLLGFNFSWTRDPLVFTGKSDTPPKAAKRYMSTAFRVKSWYEGDIWDPNSVAGKNLILVRKLHEATRKQMTSTDESKLEERVKLKKSDELFPTLSKQVDELSTEFESTVPPLSCPVIGTKTIHMNQQTMALTQFAFAGLVLLFPKMYGIHRASDDDLDAFAHFWRVIGFALGIEDRYNLFTGDLKTVTGKCSDILNCWFRPLFRYVNTDGLHMARCVFEGMWFVPFTSFDSMLLYLCDVLEIHAPKLRQSLGFRHYLNYTYMIVTTRFILQLPFVWYVQNFSINVFIFFFTFKSKVFRGMFKL